MRKNTTALDRGVVIITFYFFIFIFSFCHRKSQGPRIFGEFVRDPAEGILSLSLRLSFSSFLSPSTHHTITCWGALLLLKRCFQSDNTHTQEERKKKKEIVEGFRVFVFGANQKLIFFFSLLFSPFPFWWWLCPANWSVSDGRDDCVPDRTAPGHPVDLKKRNILGPGTRNLRFQL
jgi:hypothetical protein